MEESVRFKPTASGGSFNPLSMHPVGSIYQSVNPTDPAQLFGGTWQMLKDVFLMAAGDKYAAGSTGGEAEHVLTEAELPAVSTPLRFSGGDPITVSCDHNGSRVLNLTGWAWDHHTAANASISFGSSQPHNNLPPYLAVYTWVRVA